MSAVKWTAEQQAVIDSIDKNTLVSASAGSGKTAVMLERVMRLIVGDKSAGRAPVPLRKIIIVTFNESVASELKSKISAKLSKLIDSGEYDVDYLSRQIEDIPLADISTLHSFCGMLIKTNFEYLGVQPSYSIVDDEEKQTLFGKAIENVLKKYMTSYDYELDVLINYLGGERSFCDTLSRLHDFLEAQLDRKKFLDEIALSSYSSEFKKTSLAKAYMQSVLSSCVELLTEGYDKLSYYEQMGMDNRADHIKGSLDFLKTLMDSKDIEKLSSELKLMPKAKPIPRSKKDDSVDIEVGVEYKYFNDRYKDFVKGLKEVLDKDYSENQAIIDKNRHYVQRLVDILASVADEYAKLKRKDNKMDFADLEYYAVKLLQNDEIAKEISQKYEYVCVDEYQDVNAVQEYVLNRVSNGNNLFMVGDVKQSIYQFRMTDPQIFLTKYRAYREDGELGSPHSLNKNYRSSKEVIDFVNAVFNKIMTENFGGIDYRRESQLSLGNTDYEEQSDEPISITSFAPDETEVELPVGEDGVYSVRDSLTLSKDSVYQEGVYIAEKISSLVGKVQIQVTSPDGGMTYRPIRFSDIALLCPKRSDGVEKIIGVLKSVGIPVDGGNILKDKFNPSVALIIDFIKILDNHRQDVPLVAMLTCKAFSSLTYADMSVIKREYRNEKFFCDAIEKYMSEQSDGISAKLKDFFAIIDKYRFASSFMSVSALIRRILIDFDYRSFALSGDGGESEYAGLERFIGKLEGKPYNLSIAKFAESADSIADFGSVSSDVSAQGDFVKTSTIHASKGLEYPIVFLIDVSKQASMRDLSSPVIFDKNYGFAIRDIDDMERSYDDSLPMNLIKSFKTKDMIEEYMRLFYVATTRARNKLFITATTTREFGEKFVNKPKSMWDWLNNVACEDSAFMDKYYYNPQKCYDEIDEEETIDVARKSVDNATLQEFANMLDYKYEYQDATKMLVKHTVTAINNEYYESRCNTKRTYANDSETLVEILKNGDEVERADVMTSSDEGIAYHRVLECIDYDCFTVGDVENNLDSMVERGLIGEEQRKVVDANSIYECLQSEVMQSARKHPHYREKQFMLNLPAIDIMPTSVKDKVLLQGTIDLFINGRANGGENILVDFKFSRKSEKQIKERYRRQLELYSTAIEECMGEKVDKKVIFVLGRNVTIEI